MLIVHLLMEEKKLIPIFIDRIQDRRGKTIFNADKRKCEGCEEISYLKDEIPLIIEDKRATNYFS